MQYTEYKIDNNALAARVATIKANIAQRTGNADNALPVAVASVIKRFELRGKQRYTDYGPYWWALKAVLRCNGHDFGAEDNEVLVAEYCGANDFETVIMADMFRDVNLATNFVGTKEFMLDGSSGEAYFLFDPDMETD
jgi:hypothetical protein